MKGSLFSLSYIFKGVKNCDSGILLLRLGGNWQYLDIFFMEVPGIEPKTSPTELHPRPTWIHFFSIIPSWVQELLLTSNR